MIKIYIDDREVNVEKGITVFKAAENAGIEIPHLCYHPAFPPEGTCRMCLVEIEGLPKLELACSTQVKDGMKVHTKSEKVIEARKGVLEFLLAEHPLDCPICDQAGDCKLQDYYEEYGLFDNNFSESKDRREKKIRLGKYLIHDNERCVLCRRCVRFLQEVVGTGEMGVFERGADTEVNILDGIQANNNYSGNLAQLCPVGAITDTDFRFKTRIWFLDKGEAICPLCSRGCNIFIEHHRGFSRFDLPKRVYRISARENAEINNYWICDIGRFGYHSLDENRAEKIIANNNKNIESYETSLAFFTEKIKQLFYKKETSKITLLINTFLTNEELFLLKKIFQDDLGIKNIFFIDPSAGEADNILLTSDRTPNKKGAEELGFAITPFELGNLEDETEVLIIFGSYLSEIFSLSDIRAYFDRVPDKFLFTPHRSELDSMVGIMFPTAMTPEKGGSLTNVDGKVQKFSPVLEVPGDGKAEWKILAELGSKLNINLNYYEDLLSPEEIFRQMQKEIPFFEK